jgi:YD repeat-containing protein
MSSKTVQLIFGQSLTSWTLNSATETYTYNASTGNLETKAGLTLQYNDAAHVHAATNAGGNVYQYDTNGNMTSRNINSQPYTLQYDAENRLTSVSVGGVGMLNSPAVPVVAQQEPAENTTGQNHLVFYKLPALQTDLIFADGFESGNLAAWSNTTGGTDLSVTASATAIGNYGMQTVINDTTDLMVMDASPNNETHYSARFYLDPNSVKIGTVGSGSINLISDNSWHFCLYLNQEGVNYSLTLCGDDDADNWLEADPVMITDAWQAIEIEWLAASAPGAALPILTTIRNPSRKPGWALTTSQRVRQGQCISTPSSRIKVPISDLTRTDPACTRRFRLPT